MNKVRCINHTFIDQPTLDASIPNYICTTCQLRAWDKEHYLQPNYWVVTVTSATRQQDEDDVIGHLTDTILPRERTYYFTQSSDAHEFAELCTSFYESNEAKLGSIKVASSLTGETTYYKKASNEDR